MLKRSFLRTGTLFVSVATCTLKLIILNGREPGDKGQPSIAVPTGHTRSQPGTAGGLSEVPQGVGGRASAGVSLGHVVPLRGSPLHPPAEQTLCEPLGQEWL